MPREADCWPEEMLRRDYSWVCCCPYRSEERRRKEAAEGLEEEEEGEGRRGDVRKYREEI